RTVWKQMPIKGALDGGFPFAGFSRQCSYRHWPVLKGRDDRIARRNKEARRGGTRPHKLSIVPDGLDLARVPESQTHRRNRAIRPKHPTKLFLCFRSIRQRGIHLVAKLVS